MQEPISIRSIHTFGCDVYARRVVQVAHLEQLHEVLEATSGQPRLILGGGSNVLFRGNFPGTIIQIGLTGIECIQETDTEVFVKVQAGEIWHQWVMESLQRNWYGLENLALIPGKTGASPMQNIGAYGVEIKDVFHSLEAWHIQDQAMVQFNKQECEFGYRESVFKRKFRNQFVITSVTFRLSKIPRINIAYGAITAELESMNVQQPTPIDVAQAVIRIRSSKLPDPAVTGNAGSFFKNPSVTQSLYLELKSAYPDLVAYPNSDGTMKLAAGWLIEKAGWKGFRRGDAGCHARQALVLVNHGSATGDEVYQLSEEIIQSVQKMFNVTLEREVNIIPG